MCDEKRRGNDAQDNLSQRNFGLRRKIRMSNKVDYHLNQTSTKENFEDEPEILTPPPSCEEPSPAKEAPPDLPKMFLDLLEPVQGLRPKKLGFTCPICSLGLASHNSLVTHNKIHGRPACLTCLKRFPSHTLLSRHSQVCHQVQTVFVTSKYGRSRAVRSYLGLT